MERLKCLFVVGALAVVVSVVEAGPAFAAKGGNNDAAKACQQGGWQTLVPNLGDRFANQGDCVNDGARGSPPFGTAAKVACEGIGGRFTLAPTSWTCEYDNVDNPPALQTACTTDRGELHTSATGPGEFSARCTPRPF
jgi:hypothetical protein